MCRKTVQILIVALSAIFGFETVVIADQPTLIVRPAVIGKNVEECSVILEPLNRPADLSIDQKYRLKIVMPANVSEIEIIPSCLSKDTQDVRVIVENGAAENDIQRPNKPSSHDEETITALPKTKLTKTSTEALQPQTPSENYGFRQNPYFQPDYQTKIQRPTEPASQPVNQLVQFVQHESAEDSAPISNLMPLRESHRSVTMSFSDERPMRGKTAEHQ